MQPSDVLSPFLLLGVILGLAPPALVFKALQSPTQQEQVVASTHEEDIHIRLTREASDFAPSEFIKQDRYMGESFQEIDAESRKSNTRQSKHRNQEEKTDQPSTSKAKTHHHHHHRHKLFDDVIDSSLRELDLSKELYTAVLSSQERVDDISSAIMMTWGGDVSQLQVFYSTNSALPRTKRDGVFPPLLPLTGIGTDDTYSSMHALETLHYMCLTIPDKHNWYLITTDRFYVNMDPLKKMLHQKYPSEKLVYGNSVNGRCELKPGVLLSVEAYRSFCTGLSKCAHTNNHEDFGKCIQTAIQTPCMPFDNKNSNGIPIFEAGMDSSRTMLSRHLKTMDDKILVTKQKLSHLKERVQSPVTAKSDYNMPSILSRASIKYQNELAFNNSRPTHQLADEMMLDVTNIFSSTQTKNQADTETYFEAKRLSDVAYYEYKNSGENKTMHQTLGFVSWENNYDSMYEFYYIDKSERGADRITQITLGQEIGNYEVLESNVVATLPLNIVTFVDAASVVDIDRFITMVHDVCKVYSSEQSYCNSTTVVISSIELVHLDIGIGKKYRNSIGARMIHISPEEPMELVVNSIASGLISFIPIHSVIKEAFLQRCQLNAVQNNSVYIPIPYVANENNDPKISETCKLNKYLDINNFETMCVYTSDLNSTDRDFVSIYDNCLSRNDFLVNRFVDPSVTIQSG